MADQTVVVQQDRIQAIGARTTIRVPAGAVRIDGTGKYLMPGLADMHVHLERGVIQSMYWRQGRDSSSWRVA